jgi:LuxR family maltose regulon positive regulatory protein
LFEAVSAREILPKITTISAPPGYGKTVFMSELYRKYSRSGFHCIWIALDDRDKGLGGLLRVFEGAMGLKLKEGSLFEQISQSSPHDRIESIRRGLSTGPQPVILFVDNIDFCREAGVDRLLNGLVFDTPGSLKLIVSTSSIPVPFNAGRAHLELNLQTIKASDLSFDRRATLELFSQAGLADLAVSSVDEILEKTEGWPAAIRLLQLNAQAGNSLDSDVDALIGHEGHISDILSQRLMSSFPQELVEFLYEIAELRHFSPDLARIATGNSRADQWIGFLNDQNIMIIPVDPKQRLFRFHTLFRQFLIQEARRKHPAARRSKVHINAARWLMARGDQKSAFDLAMCAGEVSLVAEILERAACALVREQGDTSTFIEWIRRANEIGVARGLLATFWYAWALLFERRYQDAREEIGAAYEQIDQPVEKSAPSDMRSKLEIAEIAASVHLDASDQARCVAEKWLQQNPHGEPFDISVAAAGGLCLSRFANHEYTIGRPYLRTAQAAISQSNSAYGRCWVESIEALREIAQGDPGLAARNLEELVRTVRAQISPAESILSVVGVVRARAMLDIGDLAGAEDLILEHLTRASATGVPDTTWAGLEVALASYVCGRAVFSIDELRAVVKTYPKRISTLFELRLIQELAESGSLDNAIDLAGEFGWNVKGNFSESLLTSASEMERSAARMAMGALLLASGHYKAALETFQTELRLAQKTGRRRDQVDLHLHCADAHLHTESRTSALRSFTRAVALTTKREIFRPYLKRLRLMTFLHDHSRPKELGLTSLDEVETLARIFSKAGVRQAPHLKSASPEVAVAPLTPREVELLRCVEAGLDNSQIAEKLDVSIRTIKWHLSNLYFKLDVKNRSAAVAKGRALRFLA